MPAPSPTPSPASKPASRALTTRLNGVDSTVASLRTDLDAARNSLSEHIESALPNEVGPALKLPLILSGLEGAFASGTPFQAGTRGACESVLPDFAISRNAVGTAAATGLIRPDSLFQKFETALPEILAARDRQQYRLDAGRRRLGQVAARPAPRRGDRGRQPRSGRCRASKPRWSGATIQRQSSLLEALPQSMQDTATLVASDIRAHAEADKLVADLRARALTTATAAPMIRLATWIIVSACCSRPASPGW